MWKNGDQKTWLALPEELRDIGPEFYQQFRQFGEEQALTIGYVSKDSELVCDKTYNPTVSYFIESVYQR